MGTWGACRLKPFGPARLVVDTGLHSLGWDFDQAVEFMVENTGMSPRAVNWEVSRYVVWPGQATAYMTGMLEILTLREMVQEAQGDQFDLAGFHNVVLGEGSMPLGILETQVENFIATSLKSLISKGSLTRIFIQGIQSRRIFLNDQHRNLKAHSRRRVLG